MNMKSYKTVAEIICLFLFLLILAETTSASEIYDFNPGWMFLHSDHQIAPKEYKEHKDLKKVNLRDNMTNLELVLNMLAEVTTTELSKAENPRGFEESKTVARRGGAVAGNARRDIEKQTGKSVVSPLNAREIGLIEAGEEDGGNE